MFVVFVSYGPVSSFYVTSTINIEEKEAKKKKNREVTAHIVQK